MLQGSYWHSYIDNLDRHGHRFRISTGLEKVDYRRISCFERFCIVQAWYDLDHDCRISIITIS